MSDAWEQALADCEARLDAASNPLRREITATEPGATATAGFVAPVVPWALLVIAAVAAAGLAIVASVAPTRRATGVSPVVALAVD